MIETPIDGSPGATPPPSLVGDATSYEKLQGEKLRAERNAYALLDALAPDLVTGKRDEILTRALSKLTLGDLQSGQIGTAALGEIIGAVETAKGNTAFNWSAATPEQIKTYLLGKGVDPALAALRAGIPVRGNSDGNGPNTSGGDSAKNFGTLVGSNNDYRILGLSGAESLQRLSSGNWGRDPASVPFVKAGVNFGTVDYLRKCDKSFASKDVLKAASDVKQLGFDVNDKRAMRDHATIRHYDNDPDATNDAEKKFKAGVDNDQDMQDLLRRRRLCNDPVQQRALDSQIDEHKKHHLEESGLQRRIDDPKNHPKARAAIKDDVDHIMENNKQNRLDHGAKPARAHDEHQGPPKGVKGALLDKTHNQIAKADTNRSETKAKSDLVAGLGLDVGTPATTPAAALQPQKPQAIKTAGNTQKGPSIG